MPPTILDVFGGDAFKAISLTDSINALPFKPSRIGSMGLFDPQGITTTTVVIEEKDGLLTLIPTAARGAPYTYGRGVERKARAFKVPHLPLNDVILAADVQGIRKFGSADEQEGVVDVVNDRLEVMRQSHEVTLEYHRIGAIHGEIFDADGTTTIYNLFTEFEVTQVTFDWDLGNSTAEIRSTCIDVKEAIEEGLGAMPYDHVHAFCGKTWFKKLIAHTKVKEAFARYRDSEFLRNDPRKGFEFADIVFEVYRGKMGSSSPIDFIDPDQARFFPVGVPNLFKTYFAPADFVEAVGTIGLPYYAKQQIMKFDKGVEMHTQSNPLCICTRPRTLVEGTTGS